MKTTTKSKELSSEIIYRVELFWCNDWTNMFNTHELFDAQMYAKGLVSDYGAKSVRLIQDVHVLNKLEIC